MVGVIAYDRLDDLSLEWIGWWLGWVEEGMGCRAFCYDKH